MIVFYSWQSDLPQAKQFIAACLEAAILQANADLELIPADRDDAMDTDEAIELDQDTKGVMGIPEIANTIFQKISQCDVFVADISFVGKTENSRLLPNPNVLIELGYALSQLGSEKIVLIMDSNTGSRKKLPFDLLNRRWPLTFSSKNNLETEAAKLTAELARIFHSYKKQHKAKALAYPIELEAKITYRKEFFNAITSQRTCNLTISATNHGVNAIKGYELHVKVPQKLVLQNGQNVGKRLNDLCDADYYVCQFPATQDKPLPILLSGKKEVIAEVPFIVYDHNLPNRKFILGQEVEIQMFGDGFPKQEQKLSLAQNDPFTLMDIEYNSLEFQKLYSLNSNEEKSG